jgi:hypothetical protein
MKTGAEKRAAVNWCCRYDVKPFRRDRSLAAASSSLFENVGQGTMSGLARLFARGIAMHRPSYPLALRPAIDFPYKGPSGVLLSAYLDGKVA